MIELNDKYEFVALKIHYIFKMVQLVCITGLAIFIGTVIFDYVVFGWHKTVLGIILFASFCAGMHFFLKPVTSGLFRLMEIFTIGFVLNFAADKENALYRVFNKIDELDKK